MRLFGLVLVIVVFVGACAADGSPSETTLTSTTSPAAAAAGGGAATTAGATATTAGSSATTEPAPAVTTTTTLELLDRTTASAGERMVTDVASLVAFGPRVEGSEAEAAAAAWIADRLLDLTGGFESMRVELPDGLQSRNLWVTFGDPESGPWTLLGAHYDSITGSPGADDNASGTAVLLELVARLAEEPPIEGAVTIVLFGAEEVHPGMSRDDHHYGSRQWVAAQRRLERPLPDLMVSVDMVGVGAELYAVSYAGTSTAAVDALVAAGNGVGVDVRRLDRGDISDHEPFALEGIPAAMLWRPSNPDYHAAGDIDVDAARVIDVLLVVEHLLTEVHGIG